MADVTEALNHYVSAIRERGITIYDPIEVGNPELWIPTPELESLLDQGLVGSSLVALPLRTRSKVVKERICKILGYPTPKSFKRTRPRFPGQGFDTYVQKSNNLQVWNEDVSVGRRYVLVGVDAKDLVIRVRVVDGDILTGLDATGTLTQKYQARLVIGSSTAELLASEDTTLLNVFVGSKSGIDLSTVSSPSSHAEVGGLLSIAEVFDRLLSLVGASFLDSGHDQERNRGADLQRLVCRSLGYVNYHDDGRFPDIRHQLLEVKLQTSTTIDLGLVKPDSIELLDMPPLGGQRVRYCDVRYVLFYGTTDGRVVKLTHLFATTGERFHTRFPQFQGNILNKKIQIRLPSDFFGR